MSSRHKARDALLRALYLAESRGFSVADAFEEMELIDLEMKVEVDEEEAERFPLQPFCLDLDTEEKNFALGIASRIEQAKEDFNETITSVLENWDFSRVSRIDRFIMWIALAEMKYLLDIPVTVSINEAVELAKDFSSEKSPVFINGVLDAAARKMGVLGEGDKP